MVKGMEGHFATAFHEAGGQHAMAYSGLIRFIAIALVILAVLWSIAHFMDAEAKASEIFLEALGSRVVRLFIGLSVFICLLTVKGG